MDNDRRLALIEAEYLRHVAMARADPDRLRKGDEKT